MLAAARRLAAAPGLPPVNLYKNNTDNKGASYGTHENYLMRRETPFADIVRYLTPFFVSRQVIAGAGRVGLGQDGTGVGFQVSQRADFFEVEVGLETTLKRPIINTRDEPHASADRFRRLHVIVGDATHVRGRDLPQGGHHGARARAHRGEGLLGRPVGRPAGRRPCTPSPTTPTLTPTLRLRDGRTVTAVQLQWMFLEQVHSYLDDRYGSDLDPVTGDVVRAGRACSPGSRRTRPTVPASWTGWRSSALLEGFRAAREPALGRRPPAADRPAVVRRPAREGALPPAGGARPGRPHRDRRRDRAGRRGAAGGHPRLLPRPLPGEVRRERRRGVLGLGDLRHPEPRGPAAGADARPLARYPRARRRPDRPVRRRRPTWSTP